MRFLFRLDLSFHAGVGKKIWNLKFCNTGAESWEAETGKAKKKGDVDVVGNGGSSSILVLPLSCCALLRPG